MGLARAEGSYGTVEIGQNGFVVWLCGGGSSENGRVKPQGCERGQAAAHWAL